MVRFYLSRISIEGFRGINNGGDPLVIKFQPDAVNSIHAHNGVGKTSIFEAIHYAIFGNVPRLSRLQGAERPESYIVNRFHPSGEATIALSFVPDDGSANVDITVHRSAAGVRTVTSPTGHSDPEAFLRSLRQDFVLVDYSKFAEFVDASALDRGRSFASLVGLSQYSIMRRALEGASETRSLTGDLDLKALQSSVADRERESIAASAKALAAFQEVTGEVAASLSNSDELCGKVSGALSTVELLKAVIGSGDIRTVDLKAAEAVVEAAEGGPLRTQHAELLKSEAGLKALGATGAELAERIEINRLASERDTAMTKAGSPMLRDLYQRASRVVSDASWSDPRLCPICDTTVDTDLITHLQSRIAQYASADEATERLEDSVRRAASISRFGKLEAAAELNVAPGDRLHGKLVQAAASHSLPTAHLEAAFARLDALEILRVEAIAKVAASRAAVEKQLPPSLVAVSKKLAAAKQFCESLSAYSEATRNLDQARAKLAIRKRWQKFIGEACEIYCSAESKLANDRMTGIQADYQLLFGELVRGGPNVKPSLERAAGSENVDLKLLDFHGLRNINARAVLSESYRNAVAASIFLSAAVRYNGTPRFVILDDVTSSFDAGHQFSLMEAIRKRLQQSANPDGLQFIILSHDSALEKYFDRQNGTTDWSHQKLQGMPPIGRVMISAQQADRLKIQAEGFLNAGQVDLGAPFVRQYLEYKLGYIISKLEIPVPPDYVTRGDSRTLSTYLTAIVEMVDLYSAAGTCVLTAAQKADVKNTHAPSIMANYISHYESGVGTPIGAYALLGVLQSVDDLADCFTWFDTSAGGSTKRYYRNLDRK